MRGTSPLQPCHPGFLKLTGWPCLKPGVPGSVCTAHLSPAGRESPGQLLCPSGTCGLGSQSIIPSTNVMTSISGPPCVPSPAQPLPPPLSGAVGTPRPWCHSLVLADAGAIPGHQGPDACPAGWGGAPPPRRKLSSIPSAFAFFFFFPLCHPSLSASLLL